MCWRSLCVVVVVDGLSRAALGHASFNGLGQFPGFPQGTYVGGVSNDGQVIVGWAARTSPSSYSIGLVWRNGAWSALPEPLPNQPYHARAVSQDGSAIAGATGWPWGSDNRACAWRGEGAYSGGPGSPTISVDITHDGELIVVGDIWGSKTFIWNPTSGTTVDYTMTRFVASRFAKQAKTIAGSMEIFGFGGVLSLLDPSTLVLTVLPWRNEYSRPAAANADASQLVQGPWSYNTADPTTRREYLFQLYDISNDGSVIIGQFDYEPMLWTEGGGAISLRCALGRFGISTVAWQFAGDFSIRCSGDGLTIVGNGTNPQGQAEGWIARFPFIPHAADFDASGFVDTDDYGAFVAAFNAGDWQADFDASGFVDTDDFDAFVLAFETGC